MPDDEAVGPGELPGTRAEAQQGGELNASEDVVAYLTARQRRVRVAQIVVTRDVLVSQARGRGGRAGAMGDLLGADFALAEKNTLYRCLDKLVEE